MKSIILLMFFAISLNASDCLEVAWGNYNQNQYSNAIENIEGCLDDRIEDGDVNKIQYAMSGLSLNYYKLGIVDSALKYSLIAYDIEKKNELSSSKTLNQLGLIYIEKGMNHKAIYYLKNALSQNTKESSINSIKNNNINLGLAYLNLNMLDSASKYLIDESYYQSSNDNCLELIINISLLYFKENNIEKSLSFLESNVHENHLNTKLDSLFVFSNIESLNILNDSINSTNYIEDYYELTQKNKESIYFADANYKKSLLSTAKGNRDSSIKYLNTANSIYVSLGNITRAKEITNTIVNTLKNEESLKQTYTIEDLSILQNIEFSKQLENEIQTKLESERFINEMNEDLYYTSMSLYLATSLLLSLLLSLFLIGYKIRTSNKIDSILSGYQSYLKLIHKVDSGSLRKNLSIIANYMVLDESFSEKQEFTTLIDNVIKDTNEIRRTVKNGLIYKQNERLEL